MTESQRINDITIKVEIGGFETYAIDENTIGVRPKWISVEDELPGQYDNILMTYNDLVAYGEFANGKFLYPNLSCTHRKSYCKCEEQEGITHWMPLPGPPK